MNLTVRGAVVVTGAGSGIGRSAALACARSGASVVALDLDLAAGTGRPCARPRTSAGIDRGGPADELDLDVWQDVIGTNVTGTFLASKHVLRAMLEHGEGGAIVALSPAVAEVVFPVVQENHFDHPDVDKIAAYGAELMKNR